METLLFILTAVQALYAVMTFHRHRVGSMQRVLSRPSVIIASFMLLTWAAVGFDLYQRQHTPQVRPITLFEWGVEPATSDGKNVYSMTADVSSFLPDKDVAKVMLINRVEYSDIDRMTDNRIEKGGLFTITPGPMRVISVLNGSGKLRIAIGSPIRVEYNLVLLPNRFSSEQVLTLNDVEKLGGRILTTAHATGHYGIPKNPLPGGPCDTLSPLGIGPGIRP